MSESFPPPPQEYSHAPAYGPDPASLVKGPGNALLVTAILGIIGSILSIGFVFGFEPIMEAIMTSGDVSGADTADLKKALADMEQSRPIYIAQGVVGFITSIIAFFGAVKMKKLEGYGLAMTACILVMIPFISPCCCLIYPFAFGIWGIVTLCKPEVKAAFH